MQSAPSVPPQLIPQLMWGFSASNVLRTSVELDMYSAIQAGHNTVDAVSRECGCSERGARALLDAMAGFGLLVKTDGTYRLTPESETYLVKSSPYYMGGMVNIGRDLAEQFQELTEVVRSGKPAIAIEQELQGPEFFAKLVSGLFALNYPTGRFLADKGVLGRPKNILDIAVGSGAWSIPLAECDPEAHVTGLDFKDVLPVSRQFFERHGVGKQFTELPGNLRDTELGSERYDLIILGHILHSEGEQSSRSLLQRVHRALKPGGSTLIAEFIPNDERTGPPVALTFTLNMLIHTTEGTTFTMRELTDMLNGAGFSKIRTVEAPAPSPLVVAEK